jgi:hypothetical protein
MEYYQYAILELICPSRLMYSDLPKGPWTSEFKEVHIMEDTIYGLHEEVSSNS